MKRPLLGPSSALMVPGFLGKSMASKQILTVFNTAIGWVGVADQGGVLQRIRIGYSSQRELYKAFAADDVGASRPGKFQRELKRRIEKMLTGAADDFLDLEIDTGSLTEFQLHVVDHCRQIPFACTATYGQLAAAAGRPKAARAVGTVMSKNRFPLVVPCHRVVAAGSLGGFTAPRGLSTKQALQAIESQGR